MEGEIAKRDTSPAEERKVPVQYDLFANHNIVLPSWLAPQVAKAASNNGHQVDLSKLAMKMSEKEKIIKMKKLSEDDVLSMWGPLHGEATYKTCVSEGVIGHHYIPPGGSCIPQDLREVVEEIGGGGGGGGAAQGVGPWQWMMQLLNQPGDGEEGGDGNEGADGDGNDNHGAGADIIPIYLLETEQDEELTLIYRLDRNIIFSAEVLVRLIHLLYLVWTGTQFNEENFDMASPWPGRHVHYIGLVGNIPFTCNPHPEALEPAAWVIFLGALWYVTITFTPLELLADANDQDEDQAVVQAEDQPEDQAVDQPEDQAVNQAEDQPEDQADDQAEDQAEDQPKDQAVNQFEEQPNNQTDDQAEDHAVQGEGQGVMNQQGDRDEGAEGDGDANDGAGADNIPIMLWLEEEDEWTVLDELPRIMVISGEFLVTYIHLLYLDHTGTQLNAQNFDMATPWPGHRVEYILAVNNLPLPLFLDLNPEAMNPHFFEAVQNICITPIPVEAKHKAEDEAVEQEEDQAELN